MFQNLWRELSYVSRWGILRHSRRQSVAEHSYYVAVYAGQIADMIGWPGSRGWLLGAALVHDLYEGRSGDIPAPFKRQMEMGDRYAQEEYNYIATHFPDQLKYLEALRGSPMIGAIVRVADRLEGCIFLGCEWMSGNRYAGTYVDRGSPARDIFLSLREAWAILAKEFDLDETTSRQYMGVLVDAVDTAAHSRPTILMASREPI